MSNQKNVFTLAEQVAFDKKGCTRSKRSTILANYKILLSSFENPRTLFMFRDAPCLKVLIEAQKEGWRSRDAGSVSTGKIGMSSKGRAAVMTTQVKKLAFYGKQTASGFQITDRNLKNIWDAIVNFVKIYGQHINFKGDLEIQQASLLYWLNQKYTAFAEATAEAAYRTTQATKEAAANLRKQQQLETRSAIQLQRVLRGWYSRQMQAAKTLQDLQGGDDLEDWESAW